MEITDDNYADRPVTDTGLDEDVPPGEPLPVVYEAQPSAEDAEDQVAVTEIEIVNGTTDNSVEPESQAVVTELQDESVLEAGQTSAPGPRRPARWLQIVAAILLLCLLGGIVFAVWLRPGASSHSQATRIIATPTPVLPLQITSWCVPANQPIAPTTDSLTAQKIVALSLNDIWLLGATEQNNQKQSLLEHWNGASWGIVTTADASAIFNQLSATIGGGNVDKTVTLNDLAVLSAQNIWLVGSVQVSKATPSSFNGISSGNLSQTAGRPLIEHWDGQSWQIVASPAGASVQGLAGSGFSSATFNAREVNTLTQISAISASDIWAVGTQAGKDAPVTASGQGGFTIFTSTEVPLIEHWNGANWTEQKLPGSLQGTASSVVGTIQALSASDVWSFSSDFSVNLSDMQPSFPSVGSSGTPTITTSEAHVSIVSFVLHWNGQQWSKMQLPAHVLLNNIDVLSDNNIWAIGEDNSQGGTSALTAPHIIYHWDGTTWSIVPGAPGANQPDSLGQWLTVAPDNIWLAGSTSDNQPILEHWDGQHWSQVSPTVPAYGYPSGMAIVGSHAWLLVDPSPDPQSGTAVSVSPNADKTILETSC